MRKIFIAHSNLDRIKSVMLRILDVLKTMTIYCYDLLSVNLKNLSTL
jgi:hypothetical protein